MHASGQNPQECPCLSGDTSYQDFEDRLVGVDRSFGEVTVSQCKRCGQFWLHYLMEYEYLTAAGRWFRGPITPKIAASVTAANATKVLEELDWYFRPLRSEEHTSELQSQSNLVCRLLLEKKKQITASCAPAAQTQRKDQY